MTSRLTRVVVTDVRREDHGEEGWICKTTANHAVNPVTGNNFRTDIAQAIGAAGFVPVLFGAIGGGSTASDYCRLVTT